MSNERIDSPAVVSQRRLWFGTAGPMTAWILHGISSFVISDAACAGGHVASWASFSIRGLQAILIGITVVALSVSVGGGLVAYGAWRSLSAAELHRDPARARGEFLAAAGVFISIIFSLAIIWAGLAPLLTGLCEATR